MANNTDAAIDRLVEWFVQHGGFVHPAVRFGRDSTGGICARAKDDIHDRPDSGLHLLTCPRNLQLSYHQAPAALQGQLPEHVLANLALVAEVLFGEQSLWAPYLSCLPTADQLTTPIYFEEEMTQEAINEKRNDTAWLLGTNLDKAWRPRQESWKADWDTACRAMKEQGVSSEAYTWDRYKWAATMFTSRSFISDPGLSKDRKTHAVLLPVVDLLNHRFPSKVSWFFDNGAFQLRTEEPVVNGQELFNNYGGKGNEELLNGYGFCIPGNRCDEVAIRFGQLPEPVTAELEKVLGKWDPSNSYYIRGSDHYDGLHKVSLNDYPEVTTSGVPQTVWTVMEVLKKFQDSQRDQRAAWRSTLSARCDILEVLATKYDNIDQYCDFLPEQPKNLKQRYAKMYRDGQMKILKENADYVEKLLAQRKFISLDDAAKSFKQENEEVGGRDWEQAMDITFKTDDLPTVREQGVEREAWILWLCAAWLSTVSGSTKETSSRVSSWINDLLQSHPYDESVSNSHLPMAIRQLRSHAGGIWQDPKFGPGLYHWAAEVVDAEARMLAYLDDNELSGRLLICMTDERQSV